jgi:hypothetical protein
LRLSIAVIENIRIFGEQHMPEVTSAVAFHRFSEVFEVALRKNPIPRPRPPGPISPCQVHDRSHLATT